MSGPFDILLQEAKEDRPHVAELPLLETSGRYRIGPPLKPVIPHDGGHLARYGKRDPEALDWLARAAGGALVMGSEGLNTSITGALTTFGDMADANAAYHHFPEGKGAKRHINYERYLEGDPSGKEVLPALFSDFKVHVEKIGRDREHFSVTSTVYDVGNGTKALASYPVTQNWRKTLGAHFLWVSADVKVQVINNKIWFIAHLVINMEDMYNFNPDDKDMDTGIPDSVNGRLETSGLAHQYLNYDSITRDIEWEKGTSNPPSVKPLPSQRHRKPSNNISPINRI